MKDDPTLRVTTRNVPTFHWLSVGIKYDLKRYPVSRVLSGWPRPLQHAELNRRVVSGFNNTWRVSSRTGSCSCSYCYFLRGKAFLAVGSEEGTRYPSLVTEGPGSFPGPVLRPPEPRSIETEALASLRRALQLCHARLQLLIFLHQSQRFLSQLQDLLLQLQRGASPRQEKYASCGIYDRHTYDRSPGPILLFCTRRSPPYVRRSRQAVSGKILQG